jgi:thiol-disulfide isomerase/thioredoxin
VSASHAPGATLYRLLALALVALAVAGCAGSGSQSAPEFVLSDPQGREFRLPDTTREGVDIYYFWATWCPFCRQIKPYLQSLVDEHGDSVRVFAINFREYEDRDPVAYLRNGGWDFTLLLEGERIADDYGAWVLPGVYVVDREGLIRFNLYDNRMPNPEGYERLSSAEQATIRAPWWGQRIREAVEALL